MWIRRRTLERMLTDRDRAHAIERRELIAAIREQSDRLLVLAGQRPLLDHNEPVDEPLEPEVEDELLELDQMPDDLGVTF